MRADFDVVFLARFDCSLHYERVACMESACYIGVVDQWDELVVWAAFEVAIALAEIDVDHYFVLKRCHDCNFDMEMAVPEIDGGTEEQLQSVSLPAQPELQCTY